MLLTASASLSWSLYVISCITCSVQCKMYRVSHETWQLVNSFKYLLPKFVKLYDTMLHSSHIIVNIDFKVKYIWVKDVLKELTCKKSLNHNTVFGRRHSELFTNCPVSRDTLCSQNIYIYISKYMIFSWNIFWIKVCS